MSLQTLREWLKDRAENSERISRTYTGMERAGWELDAAYFRAALSVATNRADFVPVVISIHAMECPNCGATEQPDRCSGGSRCAFPRQASRI